MSNNLFQVCTQGRWPPEDRWQVQWRVDKLETDESARGHLQSEVEERRRGLVLGARRLLQEFGDAAQDGAVTVVGHGVEDCLGTAALKEPSDGACESGREWKQIFPRSHTYELSVDHVQQTRGKGIYTYAHPKYCNLVLKRSAERRLTKSNSF